MRIAVAMAVRARPASRTRIDAPGRRTPLFLVPTCSMFAAGSLGRWPSRPDTPRLTTVYRLTDGAPWLVSYARRALVSGATIAVRAHRPYARRRALPRNALTRRPGAAATRVEQREPAAKSPRRRSVGGRTSEGNDPLGGLTDPLV